MSKVKVAITLEDVLVTQLDQLVAEQYFSNRSQAIQEAVAEKLARFSHGRLARECAKLDLSEEEALAEEGMEGDFAEWPEY
ncbi:MAG: hypothetical protein KC415_12125 [Anaerolineales bacterium]|nr:hypothetical protein [Anaerolineales bacterium]MCB8992016.1 CopG family transcriptional regulator [Ardenticatenaceae bacterium]MCB9004586.1 CopG family transcriptional regulator [Ardenticatenaceae bacterium]